jgi:hypothetical protein
MVLLPEAAPGFETPSFRILIRSEPNYDGRGPYDGWNAEARCSCS